MLICKVTGTVVATRKCENLKGGKFLIVEPFMGNGDPFVAIDNVGAGIGEIVLVVCGSAARVTLGESVPVDAAIVGIVDDTSH